jgi:Protein of unknown function (DUF2490)
MAVKAQSSNEQVWVEYMLNYSFANSFNLENAFTYSTLLGTPKWRALDYSATLEWSINQHVDIMAQTVISYTKQTESDKTLEIRPVLGTRLYFTPNKRIQTRLLLRIEQRNFQDLGTNTWTQTWRPRVRAESIIPINKDSYFQDKLWYAITDFEWLIKTDDVEERFANRLRWRIGGGYRFSYTLRAEFLYMLQQSKNAIDGTYESTDNIFRIRVKYFLRKTNPSTLGGTGN